MRVTPDADTLDQLDLVGRRLAERMLVMAVNGRDGGRHRLIIADQDVAVVTAFVKSVT